MMVPWDEAGPANVYTWSIEYLPFLQNIVLVIIPEAIDCVHIEVNQEKMLPGKMIIQSPAPVVHRWRILLEIRQCERQLARVGKWKKLPHLRFG